MFASAALDAVAPSNAVLVAIALLGELLSVVFVYRVLVRGGSPASTLLWMVVILAAPWLGLLLYYLLPRRLQLRRLKHVRRRGNRLRENRPRAVGVGPRGAPADSRRGLEMLLAGGEAAGLVPGNELSWLPGGKEFSQRAAEAVDAAQQHVHFVVYIFRPDAAGLQFLAVLARAARRGVKVRLLFDGIGSIGLKRSHLAELRAAGGQAEAFLPLLWKRRPFTMNLRNHRKYLIVDGNIGFVGGRNVGDEYFTDRVGQQRVWLDAMLELRGPVVPRLQEVFVEDWCAATDEVLPEVAIEPKPFPGGVAVGIVCSGPDREQTDLWFALVQAISDAASTVDLSSPYLVPPTTLKFALQLAAARGVRVRVYTNGPKAEAAVLYHAQRSNYESLLSAGVELYETVREYNHAKLLVVDDRTVLVGSANMDLRSAHLNFEIAAVATDAPELAAAVMATIDRRREAFRRITAAEMPVSPVWRALDGLAGLLSPLL